MKTVREYIDDSKKFVQEHAPVITAVASAVTAVTVIRISREQRSERRHDHKARKHMQRVIGECIDEGRDYTYHPGLGVHIHAAKDTLTID